VKELEVLRSESPHEPRVSSARPPGLGNPPCRFVILRGQMNRDCARVGSQLSSEPAELRTSSTLSRSLSASSKRPCRRNMWASSTSIHAWESELEQRPTTGCLSAPVFAKMSLLKLGSKVNEAAQGIGQAHVRDRPVVELRKRSTGSVSAEGRTRRRGRLRRPGAADRGLPTEDPRPGSELALCAYCRSRAGLILLQRLEAARTPGPAEALPVLGHLEPAERRNAGGNQEDERAERKGPLLRD
jgi:hypothetical protein